MTDCSPQLHDQGADTDEEVLSHIREMMTELQEIPEEPTEEPEIEEPPSDDDEEMEIN